MKKMFFLALFVLAVGETQAAYAFKSVDVDEATYMWWITEDGKEAGGYYTSSEPGNPQRGLEVDLETGTTKTLMYPGSIHTWLFAGNKKGLRGGCYASSDTLIHACTYDSKKGLWTSFDWYADMAGFTCFLGLTKNSRCAFGYYTSNEPGNPQRGLEVNLETGVSSALNFPGSHDSWVSGGNDEGFRVGYYASSDTLIHGWTYNAGVWTSFDYADGIGATFLNGASPNAKRAVGFYTSSGGDNPQCGLVIDLENNTSETLMVEASHDTWVCDASEFGDAVGFFTTTSPGGEKRGCCATPGVELKKVGFVCKLGESPPQTAVEPRRWQLYE